MSKRNMLFEENGVYHIYNRSTEHIPIFRCAADYHFFVNKLLLLAEQTGIALLAWALLPTHFHLLVQQTNAKPIHVLLHRLSTSYAMYYNRRYGRTGHLFEQKFKAKVINSERYLASVTQYIEYNAIHHKLVERIEEWPFTNRFATAPNLEKMIIKRDGNEFDEMC